MAKQVRVVRNILDGLAVQPLDDIRGDFLVVPARGRYVEHEVLTIEPGAGLRATVLSSKIDPSYAADRFPGAARRAGGSFEIEPTLPGDNGVEVLTDVFRGPASFRAPSAGVCRKLVRGRPLAMSAWLGLGAYEWERRRTGRALKYFESAWRAGLLAFPPSFEGHFCHRFLGNRPLLYAANAFARALVNARREGEAAGVLARALALDPCDPHDLLELYVPLMVRRGELACARATLAAFRTRGLNHYVESLLALMEGRTEDAVAPICRGVDMNPLVPAALLDVPRGRVRFHPFRDRRLAPGEEAENHARLLGRVWRDHGGRRFLARMLSVDRFARLLDVPDDGEEDIEEVARACREML